MESGSGDTGVDSCSGGVGGGSDPERRPDAAGRARGRRVARLPGRVCGPE